MPDVLATCRFCGAVDLESPDDVAPGICPTCLDQRMAAALDELTPITTLAEQYNLLRRVGLTDEAARGFLLAAGVQYA